MTDKNRKCPNCDIELINRPIDPPDMLHCPVCPFIAPENEMKADYMYALLSVDENGNEGIVASTQFNMPMPCVGMRQDLVSQFLTDELKESVKQSGHGLVLAKFKRIEE